MKKIGIILTVIVLSIIAFYFELKTAKKNDNEPKTHYNVYLDGELLGTIKSKEELEKYIDNQNEEYKKQYNVENIYAPKGLDIKAEVVYKDKVEPVEKIYKKILNKKPFTIKGFQYTITSSYKNEEEEKEDPEQIKIYVLDKKTFTEAIETFIKTYAGEDAYESFKNKTQKQIETTGTIIENVYVKNNITVKETTIPVTEKIYKKKDELSKFFLFGKEEQKSNYIVQDGDTIETVSFNNKISTQEFLLSNTTFTSTKNLLFPGQIVTIGITNPQIQIVVKHM